MQTESALLEKLAQQIAKIEKFVIDLQKDNQWQWVFHNKKLYLNLSNIFKYNYVEYNRYLENIIKDYKLLSTIKDTDIKIYYINNIEHKIFALFKVLRSLKKHNTAQSSNLADRIADRQMQISKLVNERDSLEKMLAHLDNQCELFNQQLKHGQAKVDLQEKLLNLLGKKGRLEKELFSVVERLRLLQ